MPARSRARTLASLRVDRYSLATFCMSTRLSPSAVMPAWANPMIAPNLLTLR